jgi:hypothetical protein
MEIKFKKCPALPCVKLQNLFLDHKKIIFGRKYVGGWDVQLLYIPP